MPLISIPIHRYFATREASNSWSVFELFQEPLRLPEASITVLVTASFFHFDAELIDCSQETIHPSN